jgi:alkanesulfonate monooxygenase SsuD/methylene tetrahydromethanopterin reductase-like flavin-dependent oxidoreductase (luciferase family)
VRYAVSIPPFAEPGVLLDMAVTAEESGWDAVFLWDHLRFIVPMELDIHDPWALLSAMAVRTERVALGTCVTPLARRRPHVLAKQLVTLDHLSNGRAVLGVGLGEPPDADFADLGDDPDPRTRGAKLDESLTVIDGLVRGERVDHDGQFVRVHAEMRPAAVQQPRPPIFVAGYAPHRRPLARALRWDGFFPISDKGFLRPAEVGEYLDGVERRPGWDLYAAINGEDDPSAFAAVGVTWLVQGTWPVGDWVKALRQRIEEGPPR